MAPERCPLLVECYAELRGYDGCPQPFLTFHELSDRPDERSEAVLRRLVTEVGELEQLHLLRVVVAPAEGDLGHLARNRAETLLMTLEELGLPRERTAFSVEPSPRDQAVAYFEVQGCIGHL